MEYTENDLSVVIPFYNRWDLTHSCLGKLYGSGLRPKEVILVNDASTDTDFHGAIQWWKDATELNIRYTKNDENKGFGESMNKGAFSADGELLLLLSNDVEILNRNPIDIAINNLNEAYKVFIGAELIDFDSGWNTFDGITIPYLAGHFLMTKKTDFVAVGGFDPLYSPVDYEDIDISVRYLLQNFLLFPVGSLFLRHLFGGTIREKYGEKRMEITKKNKEKFRNKWENEQLQRAVSNYRNMTNA